MSAGPFDPITAALPDGPLLIESSAGTGKTFTITFLVLRLLLERELPIERILVVTFTTAATEELVGRVRDRLRDAIRCWSETADDADPTLGAYRVRRHRAGMIAQDLRFLRRALRDFDRNAISTIHGFCSRVLRQYAFECGLDFDSRELSDDESLLREAARDSWRRLVVDDAVVAACCRDLDWDGSLLEEVRRRHQDDPTQILLPEIGDLAAERQAQLQAIAAVKQVYLRTGLEARFAALEASGNLKEGGHQVLADWCDALEACLVGLSSTRPPPLATLTRQLCGRGMQAAKVDLTVIPLADALDHLAAQGDRLVIAFRRAFHDLTVAGHERLKHSARGMTYNDLLSLVRAAVTERPALCRCLQAAYGAALIDEFQDTDAVQYAIFRTVFHQAPCFLIGDPKQAIYRFRGADIATYLRAKRDAGDAVHHLPLNYRSSPELIAAVNTVFTRQPHCFLHEAIPFTPVGAGREAVVQLEGDDRGALHWWLPAGKFSTKEGAEEAFRAAVVHEIRHLLAGVHLRTRRPDASEELRPVGPRDLAVLVATNQQALVQQRALLAAGIPAVVRKSGNVLVTGEAEELLRLLRALEHPHDGRLVRAACVTRLWGATAAMLRCWRDPQGSTDWLDLQQRFIQARQDWSRRGVLPVVQGLLLRQGTWERLRVDPEGERRLTDLRHLLELVHRQDLVLDRHPTALRVWFETVRADASLLEEDERRMRLEREDAAVQIVTMHGAKGLQWPIVFCPFLWGFRLWWNLVKPDSDAFVPAAVCPVPLLVHDAAGRRICDHGSSSLELAVGELLAEQVRLAYVALTRARERCYVAWGCIGNRPESSPLAWLLHGPQDATIGEDLLELARAVTGAVKDWDATALGSDLAATAGITWSELPEPTPAALPSTTAKTTTALTVRTFLAAVDDPARREIESTRRRTSWRIDSYTSMTRGTHGTMIDAVITTDEAVFEEPAVDSVGDDLLAAFPRGPLPGTFLHAVIEHSDFTDPAGWDQAIIKQARRFGFIDSVTGHCLQEAAVRAMLTHLAATTVPTWDFALGAIGPGDRRDEWRFLTPLGNRADEDGPAPQDLASVFAVAEDHALPPGYLETLAALSPRRLRGYLTGSIDCVLRRDDRWFLIDWKSNHLGPDPAAYGPEALRHAMCEHHYLVQYHLYAVVLRRFLCQRLGATYDHERHFGGVAYAFLRGIRPGTTYGWYVARPAATLLDRLDHLLFHGVPR